MTIPVSQREDDDDDETASGKKKTTRTRTDYGTYTDDDDGFGMDAAAAVRRRLPSILRRLLWLGSDDDEYEYEYEHDDDGSSAAVAEAAALVVGIDKPPPSPSPSLLLFQGARRLLRDRPIAVFVVALVVVVAAAGFAAATTVLAVGKRPTTGGGSEHHHHGGGGGCRFCDQSPPILRYDEARDIPLPSPSHDDSAVDVDVVTARVVPMTVTYEYELRDGENLFTSPETERIPNLDVDYAVLGVTGFRNLRVIDEDDDDENENDGADVSLDEVYVHHFSLLPLNMLGAEVLSRDGGARDDDDDDPYMRLPPGTALRIAADERPHLSVNAHLLSNRNLAPIDGSLSRARKECNECYYSPTRGPDGWCTPENSGTFLCCGDAPVCSSSSEGGAFCGCAVTTTTTTTTTDDDDDEKEPSHRRRRYRIELDLLISFEVEKFVRVDQWNLAAPSCDDDLPIGAEYPTDSFCHPTRADPDPSSWTGGGALFHQVPERPNSGGGGEEDDDDDPIARFRVRVEAPVGGRLAWAQSHLHTGGVTATLSIDGEIVCATEATYGTDPNPETNARNERNHLIRIGSCYDQLNGGGDGDDDGRGIILRFEKGAVFEVETTYDASPTDDPNLDPGGSSGEHKNVMSMFFLGVILDDRVAADDYGYGYNGYGYDRGADDDDDDGYGYDRETSLNLWNDFGRPRGRRLPPPPAAAAGHRSGRENGSRTTVFPLFLLVGFFVVAVVVVAAVTIESCLLL